jgi:DNA polymerase-3 subunit epsilon
VVIDTETGGLDPSQHSILSLALVVWRDGGIDDELLINIREDEVVATDAALRINGIDLRTHEGDDPMQAVERIKAFLLKNNIFKQAHMAGHNVASFDYGFVKRLYRLAGADIDKTFHYRMLDTMTMALALDQVGRLPGLRGYGLDGLCQRFGIQIRKAGAGVPHNALEDARATAKLMSRLLDMVRNVHLEVPNPTEE